MSLLWNNMTYIKNTHRFRGFKLTFSLVKIQFDRRIDAWNWCLTSRKNSDQWRPSLDLKLRLLGHMFGWVIVSRQLHFHIYYLFVDLGLILNVLFWKGVADVRGIGRLGQHEERPSCAPDQRCLLLYLSDHQLWWTRLPPLKSLRKQC
jgi:hypothetical protein